MAESGGSLIDLGISEIGKALIERVSDGIGGLYRPYQIIRVARAEAEAGIIAAENRVAIAGIEARASERFVAEQVRAQVNIENITRAAVDQLEETAKPDQLEPDWIANFFDKSRSFSDEEMQFLWGSILAAEANSPRSFSRRTVNLVADLDKDDARLFSKLCNFAFSIGREHLLIHDLNEELIAEQGITFETLSNLESLGLIQFNNLGGFVLQGATQVVGKYGGKTYMFSYTGPATGVRDFPLGVVMLTRAGEELARITGREPVAGFVDLLTQRIKGHQWRMDEVVSLQAATTWTLKSVD